MGNAKPGWVEAMPLSKGGSIECRRELGKPPKACGARVVFEGDRREGDMDVLSVKPVVLGDPAHVRAA
jgi:hypothetical protein